MYLFNNREKFKQLIISASNDLGIGEEVIEKDYYVTLYLQLISSQLPEVVFKGGTSLSKCHKMINRFSEDIDLCFFRNNNTQGPITSEEKQIFFNTIRNVANNIGLPNTNKDKCDERNDFNRFIFKYNPIFPSALHSTIVVETAEMTKAYPFRQQEANSYLYDFLSKKEKNSLFIKTYDLAPFNVLTQDIERTFIDKSFAIADYVLTNSDLKEKSRHIYDLHMLYPSITLDSEFANLFEKVRKDRFTRPGGKEHCPSAAPDCSLPEILFQIVRDDLYKNDYVENTSKLFYPGHEVSYEAAIDTLNEIAAAYEYMHGGGAPPGNTEDGVLLD